MYEYLFTRRLPTLTWDAKEIIREIDGKPHLLLRLTVRGMYFPPCAVVPFMRLGRGRGRAVESWFAEISDDENALAGYFQVDVPLRGMIEFGYGNTPMDRFKLVFDSRKVERLDRKRIEKRVVEVEGKFLIQKRH